MAMEWACRRLSSYRFGRPPSVSVGDRDLIVRRYKRGVGGFFRIGQHVARPSSTKR